MDEGDIGLLAVMSVRFSIRYWHATGNCVPVRRYIVMSKNGCMCDLQKIVCNCLGNGVIDVDLLSWSVYRVGLYYSSGAQSGRVYCFSMLGASYRKFEGFCYYWCRKSFDDIVRIAQAIMNRGCIIPEVCNWSGKGHAWAGFRVTRAG